MAGESNQLVYAYEFPMEVVHSVQHPLRTKLKLPKSPSSESGFRLGSSIGLDTRLDAKYLVYMARRNDDLRKQLNASQFQLSKRLEHKAMLEDTLRNLQQFNPELRAESSRVSIQTEWQFYEDKLAFAEMDREIYETMRDRYDREVMVRRKETETIKGQLGRADNLYTITTKTAQETHNLKKREEKELRKRKTERELEALRARVEESARVYASLTKDIEAVKARIHEDEATRDYQRLQEQKARQTVARLKERQAQYALTASKLLAYREEYRRQYARLLAVFRADQHDEIVARKELRDIQLQSEANDYNDKIGRLHKLSQEACELKEQLARLKAETATEDGAQRAGLQRARLYDKGEYNADSNSYQLVDDQLALQTFQRHYEEKLELVRKVVSGIKHLLFKLQENDKLGETGTWYDLLDVTTIDDISTHETRPKFSKLLLILQHKLTCMAFLVLQKLHHSDAEGDFPGHRDSDTLHVECLLNHNTLDCARTLERHLHNDRKHDLTAILSPIDALKLPQPLVRPSDIGLHSSLAPFDKHRAIVGVSIPRFGGQQEKKGRPSILLEGKPKVPLPPQSSGRTPQSKGQCEENKDDAQDTETFDIATIRENMFEILFCTKRATGTGPRVVAHVATANSTANAAENIMMNTTSIVAGVAKANGLATVPTSAGGSLIEPVDRFAREQAELAARFNRDRIKTKLDREIKKRLSQPGGPKESKGEKKKRATALTIEITKAMKRHAAEVVDVATTTFDALERIKKPRDFVAKKDIHTFHTLIPNFVNVLLQLKKSRYNDTLGNIASRCRYFLATLPHGHSHSHSHSHTHLPSNSQAASRSHSKSQLQSQSQFKVQVQPQSHIAGQQRTGHTSLLTQSPAQPTPKVRGSSLRLNALTADPVTISKDPHCHTAFTSPKLNGSQGSQRFPGIPGSDNYRPKVKLFLSRVPQLPKKFATSVSLPKTIKRLHKESHCPLRPNPSTQFILSNNSMQAIHSRVANVRSLNQLEQMHTVGPSAFDKFYSTQAPPANFPRVGHPSHHPTSLPAKNLTVSRDDSSVLNSRYNIPGPKHCLSPEQPFAPQEDNVKSIPPHKGRHTQPTYVTQQLDTDDF